MAEPRVLAAGIAFGESVRWHDDRVWLADWAAHEILAVDLAGGREVVARAPSLPCCFDWLPDGRLVLTAADGLRRREPDGTLVVHADLRALSRYGWTDVVADGRGHRWANNVGFDFPGGAFAPGTIALVAADGSARQVGDGVAFPNGMAVTPDDMTLIVAESYGKRLTAFTIAADGSLSDRRVWADLADGVPDGICLDAGGAVWYADVPNRRCVRVAEGGRVLDTVTVDRGCFSCALGGRDGRTLFIAATEWAGTGGMAAIAERRTGQLLAVDVEVPAARR